MWVLGFRDQPRMVSLLGMTVALGWVKLAMGWPIFALVAWMSYLVLTRVPPAMSSPRSTASSRSACSPKSASTPTNPSPT